MVRTLPESRGEYAIRAAGDTADPNPHGLGAMAIAGEVCFVCLAQSSVTGDRCTAKRAEQRSGDVGTSEGNVDSRGRTGNDAGERMER